MVSAEVLDAMVASGCSAEQIVSVVKAACASEEEATERRRAKARERKRAQRAAEKIKDEVSTGQSVTQRDDAGHGVTSCDERDIGSLSPFPLLSPTPPNNPLTPNPSQKLNSRATRLPDDWVLTGPNLAYALSKGFGEPQIVSMHEAFCAWAWSASGKNAVKRSWDQAWRSWVLREKPAKHGGAPRVTTAFQQRRQETQEILNELGNFASGGGSRHETHSGLLPGYSGERPEELCSRAGGAAGDIPASSRSESG